MKTINEWFSEYGESHQDHTNKIIHFICVPLIFFSVIGLLASIPSNSISGFVGGHLKFFANFGTLAIIPGLIFYLRLSLAIFFGMLVISLIALIISYLIELSGWVPLWEASLLIFALAWIGQFYGHKVEGKKPSFFKDLAFLLIGPAWILSFIYRKAGIKY